MNGRVPGWAIAGLLLVLVFDVWYRAHTFAPTVREAIGFAPWPVVRGASEPLDCDEAIYGYIGRTLARGGVMYRDVFENKPPLGYATYALAVKLGGANETAIRLMALPLVLGTIVAVWFVGLRLGGPAAAVLSAAVYAVASTDPYAFGNGSNLEHAMNSFATAGLAFAVADVERPSRRLPFFAGVFLGMASLVKQPAALPVLVVVGAIALRGGAARSRTAAALCAVGGFVVPWIAAAAVLVAQGAGYAAFRAIFEYGAAMARDVPPEPGQPSHWVRWWTGNADPSGKLPPPFGATNYLVWWGWGTWPLWVACVAALPWLFIAEDPRRAGRRLLVAWALALVVETISPRLYWPHYYMLPLPAFSAAVAIVAVDAIKRSRERYAALAPAGVCAAAIVATTWTGITDYLLVPAEQLTIRYKGGGQWVALRLSAGDYTRRARRVWSRPRLFVWGWQSPLYLYGGFEGVTPHVFVDPLLKAYAANGRNRLASEEIRRITDDLRKSRPELIFAGDIPYPDLLTFLREHYYREDGMTMPPDGRGLWVRRDGFERFEALRRRVAAPSR